MDFLISNLKSNKSDSVRARNKKAVIWVSTVLYTLIGLAVIGMLLMVVRPKLAEIKDHFTVEQSITTLNDFDNLVFDVRKATGNRRSYELKLGRGELTIFGAQDKIEWNLKDSRYQFSESGTIIESGRMNISTEKKGDVYAIKLAIAYSDELNLTVNGLDKDQVLQPSSTPYKLQIENKGSPFFPTERGLQQIDIQTG